MITGILSLPITVNEIIPVEYPTSNCYKIEKNFFEESSTDPIWTKSEKQTVKDIVLSTRLSLLPDMTNSENENKVQLKISLGILENKLVDYDCKATVNTKIVDTDSNEELEINKIERQFKNDKRNLNCIMNLVSQEKVEKSTSKTLELQIQATITCVRNINLYVVQSNSDDSESNTS